MAMRVTFAGQVEVEVDGTVVDLAPLGRAGRLFWAYLACERHRPVPRDELAEVLWGDDELPRSWEQMLRGNATKLRASLLGAGIGPTVVVSAFGAYQVRLPDDVVVDVEHAEQELERAVGALAAGDAVAAANAAASASAIAARGFLPGWSGMWVERRQGELRELRLRALEALAQASCERGAWADAVGAAEEAIGVEPFRETAFQVLIAAHRGAGNPAEALRAYERCRLTLAEELGVSPSAATESAYLAVLTEEPAIPATVHVPRLPLPLGLDASRGSVLIGRKAETDRLRSALERASVNGRQVVLVGGEPGIGKTALLSDFARQAHDRGARVLYGRCDEELGIAYQPFAEAFGHFLDGCPLAELAAHVGAHGGELARIAPQLLRRLPDTPPPRVTGSDGDRYRFFEAAAALLDHASRDRLLVLVLDDLQWAAPQTLSLLRHILRSRPSSPLLVVGAYRHTEVGPDGALAVTLADLWREPGVERILLSGLDEDGVSAFVEASARHGRGAFDESLARALHARTAGNPFFVGEFLRHLDESGAVLGKEGRWSYYQDDEGLGLPQGVRDVVARRLRRLSAGADRVLTLASVVGLHFEIELLEKVERAASPDVVLDALDEAVAAHVVAELEPGRFQFAHALVRDTVYAALTATRRARLHHSVGDVLASLPGDLEPRLPALAHHYAEAAADGTAIQAADYALAAARQALSQAAWDDVLGFVERGLGVLSTEPEHLERRFDLLLLEIETQLVLVKIPLAIETMRRAAETALALGSHERLARAVALYLLSEGRADPRAIGWAEEALRGLADSQRALRARVLAGLAVSRPHRMAGRSDEETQTALGLARESGDTDAVHAALVARRSFLCETPKAQEWLTVEEELAAIGPPSGPVAGSRWLHGVGRGRAIARLALGDRRGFDADVRAVDRWFAELRNTGLGTQLAIWRGAAALLDGRFAEVEGHAAALADLAPALTDAPVVQRSRLALDQGRAATMKADVLAQLERWPTDSLSRHMTSANVLRAMAALIHVEIGEVDDARPVVDALAADDFAPVLLIATPTTFAYLAEVVIALGDVPRMARIYELFAPYAGLAAVSGLGLHCPGAVDRYLGQLASTLRRWDDAQEHYEAALVLEKGLRAPPLLARTCYWYGRMRFERRRPGDAERAEELLHEAAATAQHLGMARLAQQVAELR